jgi:diaminohydroxyphosphoribosylaminopyrimidine deaminase / 5-amino-6-(5-phosphoribosylamino)uracil reductase
LSQQALRISLLKIQFFIFHLLSVQELEMAVSNNESECKSGRQSVSFKNSQLFVIRTNTISLFNIAPVKIQTLTFAEMTADEQYMSRCMELASNGLGHVAPNPMVGCVIVRDGKIMGEGFHQRFGDAHAEVNAISHAIAKHGENVLGKSTLYVSLEPCAHTGKTPPCTRLIIEKKIPDVFIGCGDPFSEVNGAGIRELQKAGVRVHTGILEKECREVNRRFFTFHEKKRPYIILKWAQSLDRFIAPMNATVQTRWISNDYSRLRSQKFRTEEQAILVGSTTVNADNPRLTAREWSGKNPLRIVLDPQDSISPGASVLDASAPTIVFTRNRNHKAGSAEWMSVDLLESNLASVLRELHSRSIQSVIVEGGAFTLQKFIDQGLWDEARIFIAGKFLNDGVAAPRIDFTKKISQENILDDKLFILRNT